MPEISYCIFLYSLKLRLFWGLASILHLFFFLFFLHFAFCANSDKKKKPITKHVVEQKVQSQQSWEILKLWKKTRGQTLDLVFHCRKSTVTLVLCEGQPSSYQSLSICVAVFSETFDSLRCIFSNSFTNIHSGRSGFAAFSAWRHKVTKKRLCHITRHRPASIAICVPAITSHKLLLHQHVSTSQPSWTTLDRWRCGLSKRSVPSGECMCRCRAMRQQCSRILWVYSLRVITRSSVKSEVSTYFSTHSFSSGFFFFTVIGIYKF